MQVIPFCERWTEENMDARSEAEQESYIAAEVRRLVAEGQPVLRAILACPEEWPQFVALRLLREGADSQGEFVVDMPQVYLRLVSPDAVPYHNPDTGETELGCALPPPRDPAGHPLPPAKVGKVLVAKTGNLGGNLPIDREASQAKQYGGDKRAINAKAGRPIYFTKEVTREVKAFTLRDAILILRQWGFGIGDTAYRSPRGADAKGHRARGQCQWLVEEVSQEEAARDMLKATQAAKKAEK